MVFSDIVNLIDRASNSTELKEAGSVIAKQYDFSYFVFYMQCLHTPSNCESVIISNHRADWMTYYQTIAAAHSDPSFDYAQSAIVPITWLDLQDTHSTSKNRVFFQNAKEFGFRSGVTLPTRSPQGFNGFLSLTRKNETPTHLANRLPDVLPYLSALTIYFCDAVCKTLNSEQQDYQPLTPREAEIMKWVAEGKDNEMIASILNISVSAVAFHIRNIYKKLGAANRANAVAKALIFGALKNAY